MHLIIVAFRLVYQQFIFASRLHTLDAMTVNISQYVQLTDTPDLVIGPCSRQEILSLYMCFTHTCPSKNNGSSGVHRLFGSQGGVFFNNWATRGAAPLCTSLNLNGRYELMFILWQGEMKCDLNVTHINIKIVINNDKNKTIYYNYLTENQFCKFRQCCGIILKYI